MKYFMIITMFFGTLNSQAQDSSKWSIHFQLTSITQNHNTFKAPYSGAKSLMQKETPSTSLTSTLFLIYKIAKNTELYFNPEMAGGKGMSGATGIAGFPNGETFRVGNLKPVIYIARAFVRQYIPLGGKNITLDDEALQMKRSITEKYIVLHAGKLSLGDLMDENNYANDPRTQFMNWALMTAGAYDYAADVRGYTFGIAAEYVSDKFKAKAATVLLPKEANGAAINFNYTKSFSWQAEVSKDFGTAERPGTIRVLGFFNRCNMGNYKLATMRNDKDITATRIFSRNKSGFVVNADKRISKNAGIFVMTGYNDGKNETWCFTEIDRSLAYGYTVTGDAWKRTNDALGVALVHNGLSKDHRNYLAEGGNGFMIGDGRLNYGIENIMELYYKLSLFNNKFSISPDYQFIINPAYNKDRGPVNVIGLRFHTEW